MSAETGELLQEIDSRLRAAGDPERRRVAASYTPTALDVIGVTVPETRRIARDIGRRLKAEPERIKALAFALHAASGFESRLIAFLLLSSNRMAFSSLDAPEIERLGVGNDNWATVDAYATLLTGPAWLKGQVTDERVSGWAESPDRWWKRTALVSTVPLNQKSKGGTGDTPRTLHVCEKLVADRDDMVVKGLSWALRELGEWDPVAVGDFIQCHADFIAPRVRREVTNKLNTGLKTPPAR